MKNKIPLLSIGFRPFFLLASLIAVLNPTFWISSFKGYSEISPFGNPLFWHAHEMIFGFSSALLAGFLLTASSNWTGKEPYKGFTLLFLIVLWCLERASFFLPLSDLTFLVLSNLFLPTLILLLGLKLHGFPKQQFVFIPFLMALFIAKVSHSVGFVYAENHFEILGANSGTALIRFIVFLIAGRVLPFFTQKRLGIKIPDIPKDAKLTALIPLGILCIPTFDEYTIPYLIALVIALIANGYRNYLMFHKGSLKVPMLLILHIGLNFMVLALVLEAFAIFFPFLNSNREVLHATMAGGFSIVGIGIMTRVSLGHTGREIKADYTIKIAYFSIILGAIIRVFFSLLFPGKYEDGLHYASGLWTLGFLIFFFRFLKVLTFSRPDGKVH
ncbi:MAG: NnrS family protein [Bacteriovoracaceae bacterium]|nr:NnrS family protein [Bacteriovoracaceae bacterium]